MAKKPVLVVMAAGMGSRYGGLKQIDPVGSHGEAILDYSLYDAYEAGFETAVIIIKKAIEKDFMETVGKRLEKCPMEIRYAFQELDKEVPADLLQPQLDTCWVNVGGENPAQYIRKYAGRIEILHLKDFAGSKSENMYALIGIDEDEKKDTNGKFEFRPVGSGVQNFPEILQAAKEVNTKWVVVEQDNPSMGLTPMESIKSGIDYLKTL